MTSGLVFGVVAARPDYAHVGAWRDDDGLITVTYLGIFPKRERLLGVEIGGVQQSAETAAVALLEELVRKIGAAKGEVPAAGG